MRSCPLLLALALAVLPTAAHAELRTREMARPSFGLRLGAVSAVSGAAPDSLTAIGGGAYMLFDIPGLLAEASADLYGGESRSRMLAIGLGAYAPLDFGARSETVPYVGGGLKLGWTRFGGDGATGLLPYGAVGLLVGRSWSPQVRIEAAWFFQTGTERRADGFPARHASAPMLTFGLGF
jgi:hypothetical protein